jgi:hypothetical protein
MAKEGRIRKVNARDWPRFLGQVLPGAVWQTFLGRVGGEADPRVRWTPKYVLLCWIVMGWSVQRHLNDRFREGRQLLAALFTRRRRPGGTYWGLVKATQRLGADVFASLWAGLRRGLPKRLRRRWSWHGWTVMAVDGSRVEAPRTRGNERELGRAGREKTGPQWWVTWLVHLPSGLIWDWRQGPGTSSERQHLQEMLPDLPASPLLVADAGFGGFDLWWELVHSGVDFLIRCVSNTTLLSDATWSQIERQGQHQLVYLWPHNRRRWLPLRLRLIVLKRSGKRVCLLTNVLESQRLSRGVAGELYAARWGVETDYRALKQTLERRRVLAETPAVGVLELAGNILALALLLLQAAVVQGGRVAQVSVAAALRALREALERTRWGRSSAWFVAALRAAVRDDYQRRRSKRARAWPHKKKDPTPRPPNLRNPTPRENAFIQAVELYHALKLG